MSVLLRDKWLREKATMEGIQHVSMPMHGCRHSASHAAVKRYRGEIRAMQMR